MDRLSNGDPDIRGAAVDVLGKIGGDKAAAAVECRAAAIPPRRTRPSAPCKRSAPRPCRSSSRIWKTPQSQADIAFRQQMVGLLDQIASPASVPELTKLAGKTDQPSVQRLAQVALADTVLAAYNGVADGQRRVTKAQDDLGKAKDAKAQADAQKALTDAQAAHAQSRCRAAAGAAARSRP